MEYRVEVTDNAQVEAGEIYFWINEDSPAAALRWYEGLLKAFRSLSKLPTRCAVAQESDTFAREVRQRLYGKYRILFSIEGATVYILYVRHSARDYVKPDEGEVS